MSKRTTIRIPDDVYIQLIERAKREQRTVSNLIILLVKNGLSVATSGTDQPTTAIIPHSNAE